MAFNGLMSNQRCQICWYLNSTRTATNSSHCQCPLRLVFTSYGVGAVVGVVRALMTWWKSKIDRSCKWSKARRNRSRKNENVLIFFLLRLWSAYDPVKTRLSESEAEAEEPTNHNAWNQALWLVYASASASDWFHWFISDGVISGIGVLLPTPTVWFSLDRMIVGWEDDL